MPSIIDVISPSMEKLQQEEQQQAVTAYAGCLTPEAKEKGDAGIYAAMEAMQLARLLRDVADSRLDAFQHPQLNSTTTTAAGGGVAGARANGAGGGSGSNGSNTVQLGVEPEGFRHGVKAAVHTILSTAVVEAVQTASGDAYMPADATRAAVRRGMEGALSGTSSTAVGLPHDVDAFERALPLVHQVKPRDPIDYDALQRLFALMEAAAAPSLDLSTSEEVKSTGVSALLLANCVVDPAKQPVPSTAAWEAKYNELQARYPLPTPSATKDGYGNSGADEDEEDEESETDRQHNAALQERCAALHLPYTTYKKALRDVASHEMRVFPLLCAYLSHNDTCRSLLSAAAVAGGGDGAAASTHDAIRHRACTNVKVLNLASNNLAAPAAPSDQEGGTLVRPLAPLRALASMIDANESLRYLNLRDNALGPRGVGIIAKALTKNIALIGIDLSANKLNGAAADAGEVEEIEDPLYEEEDPVFGETLEGLEALAEVLKKNKFLRLLRLAENGLHAGEDLTAPPPPEEEGEEVIEEENVQDGESAADNASGKTVQMLSISAAQERWQGVPLWSFLNPLHRYHRLRVLDLSKNFLGNTGAQMVAVAMAHNHSIEVLDLTDNAIGYSGLNHLARYLLAVSSLPSASSPQQKQNQQYGCALHTLILRQNPLACVGGASDAATGVDTRRRRLSKKQQRQAAAAIANFAAGLQRHGQLRRLILASTYLGPAASATVLRALAHLPTLQELDFSFNNACGENTATFDATAVPHIAALLYPSPTSPAHPAALQRLCLDGNNLTPAGLDALQPTEPGTPISRALRELTLSRNNLGDALEPLAAVLASGLTRLDLSYNDISTMMGLVHDLPPAVSLEDLNLSHNKLGVQEGLLRDLPAARQEAEVNQFFLFLAHMPHLAVVDLSYNDWRSPHVEQLSAIFADPDLAKSLRKLDVRHTPRVPATPLMKLLKSAAMRPTMEVFLASVPVENTEEAAAAAATADTANNDGWTWTYEAIIEVIHTVVCRSESLVDVDCGLRPADAVGCGAVASPATEEQIAQIRERLLLNALVKSSTLDL